MSVIDSVEAIPLAAKFRETFRFGTIDRTASPNVLLVLRDSDGAIGYGEACPVPAFTGETQRSIVELITDRVAPLVIGSSPESAAPLLEKVRRVLNGCPFTQAAVDTALLDLLGKRLGVSVSILLGGAFRDRIEVHGSVGWADPQEMARVAVEQAGTYRWLKLYAGRGELRDDLDRLSAVREAVGPQTRFLLDVNGLWSTGQTLRALPRLAELGVELLEQPVATGDPGGQREVTAAAGAIETVADESVFGPADAAAVAADRRARLVNLGMSKLGGPTRAAQTATVATAAGLGVLVGSVIELGIATAAGLQLAATRPALPYPSYLMGPLKYVDQITSPVIEIVDGHVAVPTGPGLGVEIDHDAVRALDAR